jgi:hypothetical protein
MNTDTIHSLHNQISELTSALNASRADVALLQRLKHAPATVKRIAAELDALTENLNEARVDADTARRAAFAANFRNMRVVQAGDGTNLSASYTITYERLCWNGWVQKPLACDFIAYGYAPSGVCTCSRSCPCSARGASMGASGSSDLGSVARRTPAMCR